MRKRFALFRIVPFRSPAESDNSRLTLDRRQNAAIARNASTLDEGARLKLIAAVEKSGGRDVEFYKD